MTQITFIKHQSWSKVGTIAGLVSGHLLSGGNRFIGDCLGVVGTTVGSFISMPADKITIKDSADIKQMNILKEHFSSFGFEALNPINTNYNLHNRDYINDICSWFNKLITVEQETCYRNKIISEKYIVFDTFHDTDLQSIILDIAPLCSIVALTSYKSTKSTINILDIGKTLVDAAIIYGSKPIINYILYTQDNLNDYEQVELEYHENEIRCFSHVLPQELAGEIVRVAA